MLEFAMTPEQKQRCSGIINGAVSGCNTEFDETYIMDNKADPMVGLTLYGNSAYATIELTDEQVLSIMKQIGESFEWRHNQTKELIADITGVSHDRIHNDARTED